MRLKPLEPGDIVDVIAPAWKCRPIELRRGIQAIKSLGLRPRVPKNLFGKSPMFANTDEFRIAHLKKVIYARDSKMIWCVRGGYGAVRMMPSIEKWPRPKLAKIFLGYSDITTLHCHLNQKWKWPTLHGPLLDRLGRDALTPREKRELLGMLFGRLPCVEFTHLKPLNSAAHKRRMLRAPVLGGNMAVLQSGLGTPSAMKPKNSILFFEDTGERPHRVDRMLTQMEQAGWFETCRAVVFGDFVLANAKDKRGLWHDVIPRFAKSAKFPVLSGMPAGHLDGRQRTLPFNTKAELHLGARPKLIVESGIHERV